MADFLANDTEQLYERLLVLRAQAEDEQALAELIGRYQGRLNYYLRRLLPVESDVDSLGQEVWLQVYRQLPKLRELAAFRTWFYRIARARALVELRRRRIPFDTQPTGDLADDTEPDFTADDAAHVHRGLALLTREHRDVLSLRFLEDMTYEEIAEVTGCGVGTVRSRLHYAKHALRTILTREFCHE